MVLNVQLVHNASGTHDRVKSIDMEKRTVTISLLDGFQGGRQFYYHLVTELCRLELRGRTVTLDAAGTEPRVGHRIVERGGHYLLSLKANHRPLHEDVAAFFSWLEASPQAGVG